MEKTGNKILFRMREFFKNESGFSFVEILIALGLLSGAVAFTARMQKQITNNITELRADSEAVTVFNEAYNFLKDSTVCESYFQGKTFIPGQSYFDQNNASDELQSIEVEGQTILAEGSFVDQAESLLVKEISVRAQTETTQLIITFERVRGSGLKQFQRTFNLNVTKNSSNEVTSCFDTTKNIIATVKRRTCNGYDDLYFDEESGSCQQRTLPSGSNCNAGTDDRFPDGGWVHRIKKSGSSYTYECRQKGVLPTIGTNIKCGGSSSRPQGFAADGRGFDCREISSEDIEPHFDHSEVGCGGDSCVVRAGIEFDDDTNKYTLSCQRVSGARDCSLRWKSAGTKVVNIPVASPKGGNDENGQVPVAGGPGFDRCYCNNGKKYCPEKFVEVVGTYNNSCGIRCNDPVHTDPAPGEVKWEWDNLGEVGAKCRSEWVVEDQECTPEVCAPEDDERVCRTRLRGVVLSPKGECAKGCDPYEGQIRTRTKTFDCNCGDLGESCCGSACAAGLECDSGTCKEPCGGAGEKCCPGNDCDWGLDCDGGICNSCGGVGEQCCPGDNCNGTAECVDGTCTSCGGVGEQCCPGDDCDGSLLCASDKTCQPCGGSGQLCCPGDTCDGDGECIDGTCESCGGGGEPCCPGDTCDSSNLKCEESGGAKICIGCGVAGQPCCPGDTCENSELACVTYQDAGLSAPAGKNYFFDKVCSSCGQNSQICCTGDSCLSPFVCGVNLPSGVTRNHCEVCGGEGEGCCPPGNSCEVGLTCDTSESVHGSEFNGKCIKCGAAGEACCPASPGPECQSGLECKTSESPAICGPPGATKADCTECTTNEECLSGTCDATGYCTPSGGLCDCGDSSYAAVTANPSGYASQCIPSYIWGPWENDGICVDEAQSQIKKCYEDVNKNGSVDGGDTVVDNSNCGSGATVQSIECSVPCDPSTQCCDGNEEGGACSSGSDCCSGCCGSGGTCLATSACSASNCAWKDITTAQTCSSIATGCSTDSSVGELNAGKRITTATCFNSATGTTCDASDCDSSYPLEQDCYCPVETETCDEVPATWGPWGDWSDCIDRDPPHKVYERIRTRSCNKGEKDCAELWCESSLVSHRVLSEAEYKTCSIGPSCLDDGVVCRNREECEQCCDSPGACAFGGTCGGSCNTVTAGCANPKKGNGESCSKPCDCHSNNCNNGVCSGIENQCATEGETCSTNSDCCGDKRCISGFCRKCTSGNSCTSDANCFGGTCGLSGYGRCTGGGDGICTGGTNCNGGSKTSCSIMGCRWVESCSDIFNGSDCSSSGCTWTPDPGTCICH